jgi:PKD domain-containing protein/Big-like domain-containing protein
MALLVLLAVGVLPAAAAPTSNSQPVPVASDELDLGGFQLLAPIPIPAPLPIVLTDITVTASAKWSGDLGTTVGWDTDKVRQGADLDVSRSAPLPTGHIDVKWNVSGKADGIAFGPTAISKDNVPCAPALSGGGAIHCVGVSDGFWLPAAIPSPIPTTLIVAVLAIGVEFDATPEGAVVNRHFTIGGNTVAGPDDVSLVESPQFETFSMPCTAQAGGAVDYKLDPFHWTPDTSATQQTKIRIINTGPFGVGEAFEYTHIDIGPAENSNPAFDLTGPGFTTAMGPLLANNIPPTIAPFGTFSGTEGSPIHFSASATSQCPIDSYVWQFSDGTTSYGPSPQRAFADGDVVYSGQLTVTDETGLSAVRSFNVDVSNAPPTIGVGPDKTSLWGVPVSFHANGSDPGSIDLASLLYGWDFDDPASPVGGVGQDVSHTFANPGLYDVTGTVTDKDGASDSDGLFVTITKRHTDAAYSGPVQSTPSKVVTLTGSLTDELGQPVAGRTVTFALGTQSGSAVTNSSGVASTSFKLTQKQGAYTVSMTFLGDAKYEPSSSSTSFTIGK